METEPGGSVNECDLAPMLRIGPIGLVELAVDSGRVVHAARDLGWARDPFDRLIVGPASYETSLLGI